MADKKTKTANVKDAENIHDQEVGTSNDKNTKTNHIEEAGTSNDVNTKTKHIQETKTENSEERDITRNEETITNTSNESSMASYLHGKPGIVKYAQDFGNNSTIHGVNYAVEPRSSFERLFWIIVIILGFVAGIYCVLNIYLEYIQRPVVLTVDSEETDVQSLPYPAITICPTVRFNTSVMNYIQLKEKRLNGTKLNEEESFYLDVMSVICHQMHNVDDSKTIDNDKFIKFLQKLTPKVFAEGWMCGTEDEEEPCEKLLVPVVLESGICFTYNSIANKDFYQDEVEYIPDNLTSMKGWNEKTLLLDKDAKGEAYPRAISRTGKKNAFYGRLIVRNEDIIYDCYNNFNIGFEVLFHPPWDYPRMSEDYMRFNLGETTLVALQIKVIKTSERLSDMSTKIRGCYFANEKSLRFFKIYSDDNCKLECLANRTLRVCNCVSFYMPHVKGTPICGPAKYSCVLRSQIQQFRYRDECGCFDDCTTIMFDREISQADYDGQSDVRNEGLNISVFNGSNVHYSHFKVYIKKSSIASYERRQLYDIVTLFGKFGGLISFFTGMSIISLVELIYFFSVRIIYNYRLYGHYWAE